MNGRTTALLGDAVNVAKAGLCWALMAGIVEVL